MLKPIPKSDISIRPFKVYKDWSFTNASAEIDTLSAQYTASYANSTTTSDTNLSFNKLSLYGQLRAQFYNGNEDNPFLRIGRKTSNYATNNLEKERLLNDSAKIISIPQKYIGEGIKPGSFTLIDNNRTFIDDSYGNIVGDSGFNGILVSLIDNETNEFNFSDQLGNEYNASLNYINVNDNEISFDLDSTTYLENLISFDAETGVMVIENATFLPAGQPATKIGNIFYDKTYAVYDSFAPQYMQTGGGLKSGDVVYWDDNMIDAFFNGNFWNAFFVVFTPIYLFTLMSFMYPRNS
jgi:hypothetical protein